MNRIECYPSLSKNACLLILAAAMIGVCIYATTLASLKARAFGWIFLSLFCLGTILTVIRLFQTGATLTVDEIGFHFLRSYGTIPWVDIERVWIGAPHGVRVMYVLVRDMRPYKARLAWYVRLFTRAWHVGRAPIELNFAGLSPGVDAVWAHIRSLHPELIGSL